MRTIVFTVILVVASNAVVSHRHYGMHPDHHHKHVFDHHRPWDYNPQEGPFQWKYSKHRSTVPDSPESSEYDSNESGDDDDGHNDDNDWWYTKRPPTQMKEHGFQECLGLCPSGTDYAPVCGTDNITYRNIDYLHCARQCGFAVSVRRLSKCTNDNGDKNAWNKPPIVTPPTNGNEIRTPSTNDWTKAPSTNGNDFWTRPSTKPPSINGNDFWTRRPSTNSFNFWSKTTKKTPSSNGNDFWTRITPRTPSTTSSDLWTNIPNTWSPSANTNIGRTTPLPNDINSIESCISLCAKSTSKSPVCGTNNFIYNNLEHLLCAQLCGVDVSEQRLSQCTTGNSGLTTTTPMQERTTASPTFEACLRSCAATSEYNPVCGTDGVTYNNLGQLWCALQCGINVGLHRQSPCPVTVATQAPSGSTTQSPDVTACIRSCPVTSQFNPVCGTDGVTYSNSGRLECAKNCGVDVNVQSNTACPTTAITFGIETTTVSMVPSSNLPVDQNKHPAELTTPANENGTGFTIPANILASIFTVAPTTAAPEDDIDPRFDNNGQNNNTDNSSIKYME